MVRLKYRFIIGQLLVDPLWMENLSSSSEPLVTSSELQNAIRDKIQSLFGDYGSGTFGLITYLKYFHHQSLIYVIRTPRDSANECLYALFCLTEIKKIALTFRTLKIASCQRTCQENLSKTLFNYFKANETFQSPPQKKRRRDGTDCGEGLGEEGKNGEDESDEKLRERIQLLIGDVDL